jgi:hypothetical protein
MYTFPNLFIPVLFPPIEFLETQNVKYMLCLLIVWIIQTAVLLFSISRTMDSWDKGWDSFSVLRS